MVLVSQRGAGDGDEANECEGSHTNSRFHFDHRFIGCCCVVVRSFSRAARRPVSSLVFSASMFLVMSDPVTAKAATVFVADVTAAADQCAVSEPAPPALVVALVMFAGGQVQDGRCFRLDRACEVDCRGGGSGGGGQRQSGCDQRSGEVTAHFWLHSSGNVRFVATGDMTDRSARRTRVHAAKSAGAVCAGALKTRQGLVAV